MANSFRSTFGIFTVKLNALIRSEILLCRRETFGLFKQSHLTMFWRHHTAQKRQVIPKCKDRFRFRNSRFLSQGLFEKRFGHGRYVFVREAHIGHREQSVSGFYRFDSDLSRAHKRVARNDLLDDGHGPRFRFKRRRRDLAGQTCFVVVEETTVFDDIPRNRIQSFGEF